MKNKVLFGMFVIAGLLTAIGPFKVLAGSVTVVQVPAKAVELPPPMVTCGHALPCATPLNKPPTCSSNQGSWLLHAPKSVVYRLGNLGWRAVDVSICVFEAPLCVFDRLIVRVVCTETVPTCAPPVSICSVCP